MIYQVEDVYIMFILVECNSTVPIPQNGQVICGDVSCTLYCNLGYILHKSELDTENAIIYSKVSFQTYLLLSKLIDHQNL